jgi:4-amino-4-deoxy-L-arabinose transferase-like glycosyltransferase
MLLLAAVAALATAVTFDARLNTNGDNAQFLVLGESILQGRGLAHVNAPDNAPHTKYPPLYPLLLAGVLALFPEGLLPAKLLSAALGVACAPLLYVLARRRLGDRLALGAALAAAVSPHILEFSHITLSEIPYLFFSLAALLLVERTIDAPRATRRDALLALLAIAATYYVKSVGLALAIAAPIAAARRRRFRLALLFAAGFGALSAPWYLRNRSVGQENLYLDYFLMKNPYEEGSPKITGREFVDRIRANVVRYEGSVIPNAVVPVAFAGTGQPPAWERVLFLAPVALAAIGVGAALGAGFLVAEIYAILFLAFIHAWPEVWSSTRFLLPLIPLLLLYVVLAVRRIAAWGAPRAGRGTAQGARAWAPLACVGLLVALSGIASARNAARPRADTPDWRNFFAAAAWIRVNTPEDAIVCSRSAYILYWTTRRKAVGYPFSPDPERVFREVAASGARYILVDSFYWTGTTGRYLVPALEAHRDRWRVVWSVPNASPQNPATYVLELAPGASS